MYPDDFDDQSEGRQASYVRHARRWSLEVTRELCRASLRRGDAAIGGRLDSLCWSIAGDKLCDESFTGCGGSHASASINELLE